MHILILGGTHFIGRYIVEALLDARHRVSIFTRGQSRDELPGEVERLRGDREEGVAGLTALAGRSWDACLDISGYTPRQVRPSAEVLRARVQRYVYVSAVSVYGDPTDRPVIESHPRQTPVLEDVTDVNGQTYGALKVACENLVHDIYGDHGTFLRPQIVVGPKDPTDRYSSWIERAARDSEMLAPGDGSDHLQVIDVRDLARFARLVIENNLSGPFNLAGPRLTWAEFVELLGAPQVVWVPAEIMAAAGVDEFELPLYRPERGPRSGLMDVSHERARRAGLTLTDPQVTLSDTRASLPRKGFPPALPAEREAGLIQLARRK